ncbi:MAG TPA: penicillin-binding protein 2 [Candidatus Aphodovivens avistercoris]|nr:penicillin-binding protein 2 [Candidatus Aphodovivens avistercoris]
MVVAIVSALLALAAVAVVILVVFAVRNRAKGSYASVKKGVRSIESVGVSSSLPDASRKGPSAAATAAASTENPADSLKPRFLAMGVLGAGIFAALAARLWGMQVLSGGSYAREAAENMYATVATPAPRGIIYDADGLALVTNRSSLTVLADPDVADDRDVLLRLSAVLGVPYNVVRQRIQDASSGAQSQRVVASDARLRDVAFISEHVEAFPGVSVQTRTVRDYPYGALAAQTLGYTGSVASDQLETLSEGREVELGDDVGQTGVEAAYDDLLAGDHGQRRVIADANGNVVEVVSETQPTRGSDIHLCLKGPVQYACDKKLAEIIAPSGVIGEGVGVGGAVVVMDVRDGGIVAMASYPVFDPSLFIGGVSQDVWDVYSSEESYNPMLNRAISGQYPAASTYKAFTSLAALECGICTEDSTWVCTGSWDGWNTGQPQNCWDLNGHGTLDLRGGIVNSCDTVFYAIAKDFYDKGQAGQMSPTAMQDFIAKYRIDQPTGIDIGGETTGRIPTPEWKAEYFRNRPEEAQWLGGDMTNMSIGQGYVLITPIELAVAYGAIATGDIMRPHVLKEVRNADGEVVVSFQPEVVATPDVSEEDLELVRDALNGVATDNASVAASFREAGVDPATMCCKTGTAEVAGQNDYAWFACYGPKDDPRYVVTCVVEQGGGGADSASPLGAEAMGAALAYDAGTLTDMGTVAGFGGESVEVTVTSTGRTD